MKNILKYIVCGMMCLAIGQAHAQNNPYVDNKLIHFGFFLGLDMLSYHIEENTEATQLALGSDKAYHPRVSSIGPGFQVGGIVDLRLHQYLNLRFTPALHFGERKVSYHTGDATSVLTIPISIPLYLKWSAPRINNYRPYVLVGGGVEFECFREREKAVILHQPFDAFVSAGFGCDFYFRWFKLCPEIKYQIGFLDAHVPIADAQDHGWGIGANDYFYTNSIKRMTHQKLSIVFNFE